MRYLLHELLLSDSSSPRSQLLIWWVISSFLPLPSATESSPVPLWTEDREGLCRLSNLGSDLGPDSSARCIPSLHLVVSCQNDWGQFLSVECYGNWCECIRCMILGKLLDLSQLHRVFMKWGLLSTVRAHRYCSHYSTDATSQRPCLVLESPSWKLQELSSTLSIF